MDGLTLPRLAALQAEWRAHPPAHWLLAAMAKYRAPADSGDASGAREQTTMAAIQAAFPRGRL